MGLLQILSSTEMDAAGEAASFFENIKPPRLEDAGLEDCALPPESITEAFLKAASAVGSIVSDSDDENDSSDALVGITEGVNGPSEGCVVEKGSGLTEAPGDKVVVVGSDPVATVDAVVGPAVPESGESCVDALQGLEIGEKNRDVLGKKDDVEKPTLAEGYA